MRMSKMLVLFDFDGTVADTFPVLLAFVVQEGFVFNAEEIARLRDLSMREIMVKLKVPSWKIFFFARRFHHYFREMSREVHAIDGIATVIRKLHKDGYVLGIVTSNSVANVEKFLLHEGIRDCFEILHSERSVFGKARPLRKIMRKYGVIPETTWYVGDEVRDIEAARGAGMRSMSVSWGFNSELALRSAHPDSLVSKPSEMLVVFS
jgi:phosphoglycolate phosphatase